jgi:hypothetical protein
VQRLTGQTSLKAVLVQPAEGTTLPQLLEHFGALGHRRSLHLLPRTCEWSSVRERHGWLPRLTLLTRLQLTCGGCLGSFAGCGFHQLASSVPHLLALRVLCLAQCCTGEPGQLSAAAGGSIAAACTALKLLHLDRVAPPAKISLALSQLTS